MRERLNRTLNGYEIFAEVRKSYYGTYLGFIECNDKALYSIRKSNRDEVYNMITSLLDDDHFIMERLSEIR